MKNVVIIRNAAADDFGGGERFPVLLATVLRKRGYSPVILSHSQKLLNFASLKDIPYHRTWWWSYQDWNGKKALFVPIYCLWQKLLYLYYVIWFLRLKPSVVHIQSKDDFIAASWAAKIIGAKIIWTDHADLKHILNNIDKPFRNPSGKLVAWSARFADVITVVSKNELRLVSQHLPKYPHIINKLRVVYNGAFDVSSDYPKQRQTHTTYTYIGRLVKDKGIGELIDSFSKLNKKYPDTSLIIVGDGPDRTIFEEKVKTNSISFVGHQDNPQQFLAKTDVFVYPTYHEGFSLSLVEAAMMSLPIITTNVGGNPEIIVDGKTGLLVPARDYQRLLSAMQSLYSDPHLQKKLGTNARHIYEKSFKFDRIVNNEFIPLYEKDY